MALSPTIIALIVLAILTVAGIGVGVTYAVRKKKRSDARGQEKGGPLKILFTEKRDKAKAEADQAADAEARARAKAEAEARAKAADQLVRHDSCPKTNPYLERHTSSIHGDVCRKEPKGLWECPTGCTRMRGKGRPYCAMNGTETTEKPKPCRVNKYFLSKDGANECDPGSVPVPKDECRMAALKAGQAAGRTDFLQSRLLVLGGRNNRNSSTPLTCFVNAGSSGINTNVIKPYYREAVSDFKTTNNGRYALVCQRFEPGTCSGGYCKDWNATDGRECTADFNSSEICCGQTDRRDRPDIRTCPSDRPLCQNYKINKRMGRCSLGIWG